MTTKSTENQVNHQQTKRNDTKAKEQLIEPSEQTLTLPSIAAVTNKAVADGKESQETEEETATLPSVPVVASHSVAHQEEEQSPQARLPRTALWTPVGDRASPEEEEKGKALSPPKEPAASPPDRAKRVVFATGPKGATEEQVTADQKAAERPLHTAVWPAASRTAPPPPAPTAVHPSAASTQQVVLTISPSHAILLTLLISFLNILFGVLIVLAVLYQLNGSLIYESSGPLERQANQLADEVEALEQRAEQLEAQQEALQSDLESLNQSNQSLEQSSTEQLTELGTLSNDLSTLQEQSEDTTDSLILLQGEALLLHAQANVLNAQRELNQQDIDSAIEYLKRAELSIKAAAPLVDESQEVPIAVVLGRLVLTLEQLENDPFSATDLESLWQAIDDVILGTLSVEPLEEE